MSDPNGAEAGVAFLAENKSKPGVVTLPSGLQYKVLEEGPGMDHPKVDTPCDCHYAGRLLDGSVGRLQSRLRSTCCMALHH